RGRAGRAGVVAARDAGLSVRLRAGAHRLRVRIRLCLAVAGLPALRRLLVWPVPVGLPDAAAGGASRSAIDDCGQHPAGLAAGHAAGGAVLAPGRAAGTAAEILAGSDA